MRLSIIGAGGQRAPWGTRIALMAMGHRLGPSAMRVQVVLGDDRLLRRLNRDFRRRDRRTDVLSFRYERAPGRLPGDPDAEVYVSVPQAARQARERGHGLRQEIVLLILHGLLHIQGHDHQHPAETRRMRKAERSHLEWLARRWPRLQMHPLVPRVIRGK